MNASQPSSSPAVGRLTGFVLGLVAFVCMIMIGAAGYVKYEIDRAESVMAAPASALSPDQEAFEQLRRALGYNGFVGFAQNYATTHEGSVLSDMRAQAKIADDMVTHLPEKTPGESRRDIQAILAVFDTALQKAEKSGNDPAVFTVADMVPLYAALPVLDSRLEAAMEANRLEAQAKLQFWSMLLTLVSWVSLIIASALAVGIYLTLRDRNFTPLRALAQSVKNMARGDMRTSIWGMERQDMVGELARAMDLARYNFSQLPDMSLLSEQGPVRLRFEGNTRSLFEAMMRVISRDSEQVRQQAAGLTDAVTKQQEAIALISSRVEAVLHNVEKRGLDGDQQIRQVLQSMMSSSQGLRNAQEHAADQLNRILPYLQERAHGMAEIAQITGKQVAQVLAGLTLSERGLRSSAEHSEEAIKKLSSVADNLGERMFGAVNLLQASGKVLAETTEKTQSRLNEAINTLHSGLVPMPVLAEAPPPSAAIPDISPRLEQIVSALEATQQKMDEKLRQAASLPKAAAQEDTSQEDTILVDDGHNEMQAGFDATRRQIEKIQDQYDRLLEAVQAKATGTTPEMPAQDPAFVGQLIGEIKTGFEATASRIEHVQGQYERLQQLVQDKPVEIKVEAPAHPEMDMTFVGNLLSEIKTGFDATAVRIEQVQGQYERLHELVNSKPVEIKVESPPQDFSFVSDFLSEVKTGFTTTTTKIEQVQEQYQRLHQLVQDKPVEIKVEAPPQDFTFVDRFLDEVKAGFDATATRFEQAQEQYKFLHEFMEARPTEIKVEAPLQDFTFIDHFLSEVKTGFDAATARIEQVQSQYERLHELVQSRTTEIESATQNPPFVNHVLEGIKAGFDATTARIEQMRVQYERLQEAALRRPPIEVKIDPPAQQLHPPPFLRDLVIDVKTSLETTSRQVGQMREQISALAVTNSAQPVNIDEKLQTQWYQMMGQIEATRTAIEQTIVNHMENIGSRIDMIGKAAPQVDPEAFQQAQKQMEQQTQILEELVMTLGMLDTHMQQLKSEIEQQKPEAKQAHL